MSKPAVHRPVLPGNGTCLAARGFRCLYSYTLSGWRTGSQLLDSSVPRDHVFRLLKWGFQLLILFVVVSFAGRGYAALAARSQGLLPSDPVASMFPEPQTDQLRLRGVNRDTIQPGKNLPGTDLVLVEIRESDAVFAKPGGETAVRRFGDSVKFDGPWANVSDTDYNVSGRIIRVNPGDVHVVSVYSITISDTAPARAPLAMTPGTPYTLVLRARTGAPIRGTTLHYRGRTDSGDARVDGLDGDSWGQFSAMDSIRWSGLLREDLAVSYNMRILFYTDTDIYLGGTVQLTHLP